MSKSSRRPWSQEETDYLIQNIQLPYQELAKKLERSEIAVKHKVHALRTCQAIEQHTLTQLSPVQEDFLLNNYLHCTHAELLAVLGIGRKQLLRFIKELGLPPKQTPSKKLIHILGKCKDTSCHNLIRRTPKQIEAKSRIYCSRACLYRSLRRLTDEDVLEIIKQYTKEQKTGPEIGASMGVDADTVYSTLRKNNIEIRTGLFAHTYTDTGSCTWNGIRFRSKWEIQVAQWLTSHNIEWQYEPKRFYFDRIKRGTTSYLPDFWLPNYIHPTTKKPGVWLEVKGWLRPEGKTAIKRFKKYYPEEFTNYMYITNKSKTNNEFFQGLGASRFAYIDDLKDK